MTALTRLATAAVVAFATGSGVSPSTRTQAVVDPANVYVGNFEGWGTSLAWGGNIVGGWSDRNRTAIADRLFSTTTGLGLNIVRYHIGAGLNPNWEAIGCGVHRPGSPLPLYQPAPGGGTGPSTPTSVGLLRRRRHAAPTFFWRMPRPHHIG